MRRPGHNARRNALNRQKWRREREELVQKARELFPQWLPSESLYFNASRILVLRKWVEGRSPSTGVKELTKLLLLNWPEIAAERGRQLGLRYTRNRKLARYFRRLGLRVIRHRCQLLLEALAKSRADGKYRISPALRRASSCVKSALRTRTRIR